MNNVEGWWLPNTDGYFAKFVTGPKGKCNGFQVDHLLEAFKHVTSWQYAIDVGAHVGFWTEELARRFEHVQAFEPAADTFDCLSRNMGDKPNVALHHAAVGDVQGCCAVTVDDRRQHNSGARFVAPGAGDVPMVALDDVALDLPCGLLKVDVEGFEHAVLRGATRLILRSRPVIVMETDKRFAQSRYGVSDTAAEEALIGLGYRVVAHMRPDKVFVLA